MQVRVSVIVPTYNSASTVIATVESLLRLGQDLEVVVADDASTDDTVTRLEIFRDDPRFRLVRRARRGGPAAARNSALELAQGRFLAFIDADMEATDCWLRALLEPLEQDLADCTGGPDLVPATAPLISRCVGHSMDSPLATGGLRWGQTRLVRYLPGTGNMAISRRVLDQVGPLNEQFRDSGEDKEWLFRVAQRGFRIRYIEDALAWHHRTESLWVHWKKMFRCGLRRVDIWRLFPESFEWPHLAPAAVTLGALLGLLWVINGWPGWGALMALAGALAVADGVLASWRLSHPGALFLAPLTSAAVPLGYGCGLLVRCLQVAVNIK